MEGHLAQGVQNVACNGLMGKEDMRDCNYDKDLCPEGKPPLQEAGEQLSNHSASACGNIQKLPLLERLQLC